MRVEDGYKAKIKFSVSFFPSTYERLCKVCKEKGIHRANYIENAVLASLDDGARVRAQAQPLMRSTKSFAVCRPKKQDVKMLAPKRKHKVDR